MSAVRTSISRRALMVFRVGLRTFHRRIRKVSCVVRRLQTSLLPSTRRATGYCNRLAYARPSDDGGD